MNARATDLVMIKLFFHSILTHQIRIAQSDIINESQTHHVSDKVAFAVIFQQRYHLLIL